jgi:hypothetical protein
VPAAASPRDDVAVRRAISHADFVARKVSTKKVLTIFPVGFIYVRRTRRAKLIAQERTRTSMSMNRTHTNSIAVEGRRASERTCAGLFSKATAFAAVLCPGSLPVYLPGGKQMHEGANSTINLWSLDRQVTLI